MFKEDSFLKDHPEFFGYSFAPYTAYSKGTDQGFVILVFPAHVELYEFNNGPYNFCGTYVNYDSAALASECDFN